MLKKSYKGLGLWMLGFVAVVLSVALIPELDYKIATRLVLNSTSISVSVLAYIIYKTEYIYWYNGVSYEQANKTESRIRKSYAYAHVVVFAKFSLFMAVFSVIMHLMNKSIAWDIIVCTIGLIVAAISTIKIKLQ